MLAWNATARPPSAVADIRAPPLAGDSVDDTVAAFVLNHLTDPLPGLAELARVTRPGGAALAAVFSNHSRSQARDQIDATALAAGWQVPGWYAELKTTAAPILGSPQAWQPQPARPAWPASTPTNARSTSASPHPDNWSATAPATPSSPAGTISTARAGARAAAERAIPGDMQPCRPVVAFLSALAPA